MRLSPRLPSSAELDKRLLASQELAARAQKHIERAQQIQADNNMGAIVAGALGLHNHKNGGQR